MDTQYLEKAPTSTELACIFVLARAGNGLVVCGDTWQETKLMFETLLQLFNVAIELRKVTATARQGPSNGVTKPAGKRVQVRAAHEISRKFSQYLGKATSTFTYNTHITITFS